MKHTSHTQKTSTDINFPPSFFLSLSISSYFSFFFFLVFDSVFRPKTIVCNVYILHIMDDCDGEVNTNSSGLMPYFFLLLFFRCHPRSNVFIIFHGCSWVGCHFYITILLSIATHRLLRRVVLRNFQKFIRQFNDMNEVARMSNLYYMNGKNMHLKKE